MNSQVIAAQSIGASGSANWTINVASIGKVAQSVDIGATVSYVAQAATSGVRLSFQVSSNGSTFTSAAEGQIVIAGGSKFDFNFKRISITGHLKLNTTPIVAIKVTATNLDGTNAATIALQTESTQFA